MGSESIGRGPPISSRGTARRRGVRIGGVGEAPAGELCTIALSASADVPLAIFLNDQCGRLIQGTMNSSTLGKCCVAQDGPAGVGIGFELAPGLERLFPP